MDFVWQIYNQIFWQRCNEIFQQRCSNELGVKFTHLPHLSKLYEYVYYEFMMFSSGNAFMKKYKATCFTSFLTTFLPRAALRSSGGVEEWGGGGELPARPPRWHLARTSTGSPTLPCRPGQKLFFLFPFLKNVPVSVFVLIINPVLNHFFFKWKNFKNV